MDTLTRPQFEHACKAFIQKHDLKSFHSNVTTRLYSYGWSWNEHTLFPGLGFMSRVTQHIGKKYEDVVEDIFVEIEPAPDEHEALAAPESTQDVFTCRQYVVFSSTFQVPAFYFTIHGSSGVPLGLDQLVRSPLLRRHAITGTHSTPFALDDLTSDFPMLSQGDHPTLGTPCWYFHPCHTAEVVEEIMKEIQCDVAIRPLRWLETWFMVVGNVVDFGMAKI